MTDQEYIQLAIEYYGPMKNKTDEELVDLGMSIEFACPCEECRSQDVA